MQTSRGHLHSLLSACFVLSRPVSVYATAVTAYSHRISPLIRWVIARRTPLCIDIFRPADSLPSPLHTQGATLLTRPHGSAVDFALCVAAAFAGKSLSLSLRY